ncbi:unnamed protein product, partial [Mesorhabditis belari]|uniref:Uncharacterized protein n=1 Tax=Mesorhabditis belari TaxID=2138241 RepID=A0AAF3FI20_9BILA
MTQPAEEGYIYKAYCGFVENPYVQEGYKKYEDAKHSHPILENSLQTAENMAATGRNMVFSTASTVYRRLYTQPKERVENAYTYGVETTKNVVTYGKDTAAKCGTLTIGAGVIAGQLSLAATLASTSLLIDGAGNVKSKTVQVVEYFEAKIWEAIQEAFRVLRIPFDFANEKFLESANSILDAAGAILEKSLGIQVPTGDDSSLKDRVKRLALSMYNLLVHKAHNQVIDPISVQFQSAFETFSKNLALLDVVRQQGKWATGKVQDSISDFKTMIETEAEKLRISPEDLLLKGIHSANQNLQQRLITLKEQGTQLGAGATFEGFIEYLQTFEQSLGQAESLYAIQEEVLEEVRKYLARVKSQWTNLRSAA